MNADFPTMKTCHDQKDCPTYGQEDLPTTRTCHGQKDCPTYCQDELPIARICRGQKDFLHMVRKILLLRDLVMIRYMVRQIFLP